MERTTIEKIVTAFVLLAGLLLLGPYFGLNLRSSASQQAEVEEVIPSPAAVKKIDPLSEIDELLE